MKRFEFTIIDDEIHPVDVTDTEGGEWVRYEDFENWKHKVKQELKDFVLNNESYDYRKSRDFIDKLDEVFSE